MSESDCQGLKSLIDQSTNDFQGRKGEPLVAIIGSHKRYKPIGATTPLDGCAIVDNKAGRPDAHVSLDCDVAEWEWRKAAVTISKEAHDTLIKAMRGLAGDISTCLMVKPLHEQMEAPDDTASTIHSWDWQVPVRSGTDRTAKPVPVGLALEAYIPDAGATHMDGNNRFRAHIRILRR